MFIAMSFWTFSAKRFRFSSCHVFEWQLALWEECWDLFAKAVTHGSALPPSLCVLKDFESLHGITFLACVS